MWSGLSSDLRSSLSHLYTTLSFQQLLSQLLHLLWSLNYPGQNLSVPCFRFLQVNRSHKDRSMSVRFHCRSPAYLHAVLYHPLLPADRMSVQNSCYRHLRSSDMLRFLQDNQTQHCILFRLQSGSSEELYNIQDLLPMHAASVTTHHQ